MFKKLCNHVFFSKVEYLIKGKRKNKNIYTGPCKLGLSHSTIPKSTYLVTPRPAKFRDGIALMTSLNRLVASCLSFYWVTASSPLFFHLLLRLLDMPFTFYFNSSAKKLCMYFQIVVNKFWYYEIYLVFYIFYTTSTYPFFEPTI